MKTNLTRVIHAIPFLFFCLTANCQDKNNLIKPGAIWPDTEGKHINAHGGGILHFSELNGTLPEYLAN